MVVVLTSVNDDFRVFFTERSLETIAALMNCGVAPSTVMIFNFSPSFRFRIYIFLVIFILFDIWWGFSCMIMLFHEVVLR